MAKQVEHDVYIYGEIGTGWQAEDMDSWGVVTLSNIRDQIKAGKDADVLNIHIHSNGGGVDEGFAIYDVLKTSGKEIRVFVEGMCASIATVIMLAGTERNMTENSTMLIHLPTAGFYGTSDEIEKGAEMLKEINEKIIGLYMKFATVDQEAIEALMDAEERITAEKAKELGFITNIVSTLKAVAYYKPINRDKAIDLITKKQTIMDSVLDKVLGALGKIGEKIGVALDDATPPKSDLTLTTEDGVTVTILTAEAKAEVGNAFRIDGKAPEDGAYKMANKETYHVKDGKIESIDEAPVDTVVVDEPNVELDNLKAANEVLTAKIATLEKQNTDAIAAREAELKIINGNIEKILEGMGSDYKPSDKKFGGADTIELSPAAAAIQRRKEEAEAKADKK